ncbi:MAG: endonuclease [Moritella sp.]|uniref:HNH endonuclease signature motif containing protein n=1 Tax=Moritella sp. TaxID=78556 RepID=UPI0029ACB024|nr:endonuclease [Moritella sp.]MDX2319233.1 endonuclease [Moritella sp.]
MNNKTKIAILLLSLTSLTACDSSDDNKTISSDTSVGVEKPVGVDVAVNGSFEEYNSDGTPTGWPTIDSGITVAEDNTTVKTGLSSGAVTMVWDKKDLRQSVDVVNGKTYTLSMSIYHTDGGVKTRLYLADYTSVYSNPSLVNQWQEISYEYKPTEDKNIEIGARFYDAKNGAFDGSEVIYIDNLVLLETGEAKEPDALLPPPAIGQDPEALKAYYQSTEGKTGFELKTALYDIIKGHTTKTYNNLWTFMSTYSLDTYYENDNTILDMYTENPSASDNFNFIPVLKQCGNYSAEGDCYNREHSMPQSWFIKASPMVSDVHHIFATDGTVNGKRSNFPYGEVEVATYTSSNGSKLGSPTAELITLGFTGDTVFEPIDEFKGDFARAYFYMATRYEKTIGSWETNSDNANAVLDGSSDKVFEPWVIAMLKRWNENDPVSPKEQYRNDAAFQYQGNRNPFIDHPEYVNEIWAD